MKLIAMPGYMIRAAKSDARKARRQWPLGLAACIVAGVITAIMLFV